VVFLNPGKRVQSLLLLHDPGFLFLWSLSLLLSFSSIFFCCDSLILDHGKLLCKISSLFFLLLTSHLFESHFFFLACDFNCVCHLCFCNSSNLLGFCSFNKYLFSVKARHFFFDDSLTFDFRSSLLIFIVNRQEYFRIYLEHFCSLRTDFELIRKQKVIL
jgi:hypothetical protein